jgi:UDP-GlcNAc:undecaprenyl-phosphate/decaprenyl-phosphate GlcNAc-1-phosphate transferase
MLFACILVFVITIFVLLVLQRVAGHFRLIDTPGAHRYHASPTPLIGGLAIFLSFVVGLLVFEVPLGEYRVLLLVSGIMLITGTLDDIHDLSSGARFLAQIIVAFMIIFLDDIQLVTLGQLFGDWELYLGGFSVLLSVFAIVGIVNAMNMSDGMDGLGGSLFFTAFAALTWLCFMAGLNQELPVLCILLVCVFAFLLFNVRIGIRSAAKVFLGDSGSLFLGVVAAWLLVRYSQKPFELLDPVTALWIVAIPLTDTITVMSRRLIAGKSPFRADRTHVHHLLLHNGLSVDRTLNIVGGGAIILAFGGIALEVFAVPEYVRFYLAMMLFSIYFVVSNRYVRIHKLLA